MIPNGYKLAPIFVFYFVVVVAVLVIVDVIVLVRVLFIIWLFSSSIKGLPNGFPCRIA